MKQINLSGPAVIAGAVRYPVEGALIVTDEQAERLKESGRLDGNAEEYPPAESDSDSDADEGDATDGLEDEKVVDLKSIAELEEIDLGKATSKPDIIAAIRAAREAKEG